MSTPSEAGATSVIEAPPQAPEVKPPAGNQGGEGQRKGTTEILFPDFIGPQGELLDRPNPEFGQPAGPEEQPAPSETPPANQPPAPVPQPEEVLSTEDALKLLAGKKIRVKVDGVEEVKSIEEIVRINQLDSHLTSKAQRIAEQEKSLKELQSRLLKTPSSKEDESGNPPPADENQPASSISEEDLKNPVVKALLTELNSLKVGLREVAEVTKEQRITKAYQAIGEKIKTELGFDDFMKFVPDIQKFALSQVKDPKNPTPDELFYDSEAFYRMKYMELKMRDMKGGQPAPVPNGGAGAANPPTPAPRTPVESRPNPPVVRVEGGGGVSSGSGSQDGWQSRYDKALQKAKESGRREDWLDVIKLKNEPAQ